MPKPIEVKSAYFMGANGQRVELDYVALPVVGEKASDKVSTFTLSVNDLSVSWSIEMTGIQALNAARVTGLERRHFTKYHILNRGCKRKKGQV
jgi:hypothetical protein